jgi:hypothetical protein
MKTVTIVDTATGLPRRCVTVPEHAIEMQAHAGEFVFDGPLPLHGCRVNAETGIVESFEPAPPSGDFEFDSSTGSFRPTESARARANALGKIRDLESVQARAMREHAIGRGKKPDGSAMTPAELRKRLEDIDDQITELRKDLM